MGKKKKKYKVNLKKLTCSVHSDWNIEYVPHLLLFSPAGTPDFSYSNHVLWFRWGCQSECSLTLPWGWANDSGIASQNFFPLTPVILVEMLGYQSLPIYHFLTQWSWARYSTSLCFSRPISKTGMMIIVFVKIQSLNTYKACRTVTGRWYTLPTW